MCPCKASEVGCSASSVAFGFHLSLSHSRLSTSYRRTLLHIEPRTLCGLLLQGAEAACMFFDEHVPEKWETVSQPVIAWEGRKAEYTDSGNESFRLISWIEKYFCCLDVPAFIHNWLHLMLEKNARSSSRMSVSRAVTTMSSVSAWMQCNITLLGQSVRWKVEVQDPVYWKEQLGNRSEAVVLFRHQLSSW